jgi:hypothetical protein
MGQAVRNKIVSEFELWGLGCGGEAGLDLTSISSVASSTGTNSGAGVEFGFDFWASLVFFFFWVLRCGRRANKAG